MDIHYISKCEIEPEVDCLILPAWEGELDTALESSLLTTEDRTTFKLLIEKGVVKGSGHYYLPTPLSAYQGVMLLGLGKKDDNPANAMRQAVGRAAPVFSSNRKQHLLLEVAQGEAFDAAAFVDALTLGQYKFTTFKTNEVDPPVFVKTLSIHACESADLTLEQAKAEIAYALAEGANWARDLSNTPGNHMTPTILADQAKGMAEEWGAKVNILDEKEMAKLGMGALLSVSRGSIEEAKLITMEYSHPKATKTVAIVGKGLTFDSGGISLKPGRGMQDMKFDMCGGAAVLGAFQAILKIKPAINVVCVVPSSENMPAHNATKPGDIVTSYSGKTIEIYNTDAEGRLILCDALSYTIDTFKPDLMINLATLTGAVITALGHEMSAVISEDESLTEGLREAGSQVHERLWPLPINEDYKKLLKGKDADLCNIGPPYAGTVTAGCFLSEFTKGTPWAHLDIAGTAWGLKGASYCDEKLASGFGARLVARWLLNLAE